MQSRSYFELGGDAPVLLGSPLRTPRKAWALWIPDIESQDISQLIEESRQDYMLEWNQSDSATHHDIGTAAKLAGLGNANGKLNSTVAELIANLGQNCNNQELRIMDVGAGNGSTTKRILDELSSHNFGGILNITLIEPSWRAIEEAQKSLANYKSKNVNLDYINSRDFELEASQLPFSEYDVIVSVAAIHHHADIKPALENLHHFLKPNGLIVIGDWHNSMWQHPNQVLNLLQTLPSWPGKESDIKHFTEAYPLANSPTEESSQSLQKANNAISQFWIQYATIREPGSERLRLLEGHRPPDEYIVALNECEFVVEQQYNEVDNPKFLLDGNSLLGVTIGRRT